jgi:hypothetical protein
MSLTDLPSVPRVEASVSNLDQITGRRTHGRQCHHSLLRESPMARSTSAVARNGSDIAGRRMPLYRKIVRTSVSAAKDDDRSAPDRQIGRRNHEDLVIPPAGLIILITGGTLDHRSIAFKNFDRFAQVSRIAELRQSLQLNLAYNLERPVPHEEPDSVHVNRVVVPCSC